MAQYEMVREVYNLCDGNKMRDIFIDEVETDDPVGHVRSIVKGEQVEITENVLSDGTIVLDVIVAGLRQRFSFTEI